MYKKFRVATAIIFFILITLLFCDFTGTLQKWFGWMAEIQLIPSILALNVAIVLFLLIILPLLAGRIYCSTVCPLGILQDIISWMSGKRKKHKNRFRYSPAKTWLRYSVLVIFVILMIAGVNSVAILIAPYSAYGRIASNLFAPIYLWGNNLFAFFSEKLGNFAFYHRDVLIKSIPTFIISIVTLVVIFILAWRNGRTYCNTICPVGTILGLISKLSINKIHINADKCNGCSLCERNCKASCIDSKNHKIDYSRCVTCFDCIDKCKQNAISFGYKPITSTKAADTDKGNITGGKSNEPADPSRREMLAITGALLATRALQAQMKVDGGLAVIEDKKIPKRATPIKPAGALSLRNFSTRCTACQLCVSACPNDVLRPSTDFKSLMQPEMSYERGYCRPECTRCSEVCPSNAITEITKEEKSSIQIGHAVWIKKNCIPLTDGLSCGNCARHCPTGAITMVPSDANDSSSPQIPAIDTERCIGCGACENLCPARPFSAIYVEGHEVHKTI
ncbi:MAG: 4Fe-4S binding protein [Bacteroidales bacterium]|nr:4Fe-4S binding protein [Bacteroidales bacterium]